MRKLVIVLAAVALLGAWGCKRAPATPEQVEAAYTAAEEAWEATTTPEAKLKIAQEFLGEHPDTKYTARVVREAVGVLADELKKPAEAEAFVREARGKVKDPANLRRLGVAHVEVLSTLKKGTELAQVAAKLAGDVELNFYDQVSIAEAAIGAEAWDTALTFASAAAEIDGEKLKALSPAGRYPTQADLDRGVNKRKAWALADKGWAEFKLGRPEDALRTFQLASTLDSRQVMGNSETSLPVYWGRTLLAAGRAAEAAEVLVASALYGGEKDARAALEEAWKAQGGQGSFDDYLWSERQRRAIQAPDFTLPDYEGKPQQLASLRGAEVTLLSFWFPT
ncbi:MAG: peroxiredoxin family protein [Thermoanaerobaculaceae bacterium]